jgi:hypothetical protein
VIPESAKPCSIPTWTAARLAPPESTDAVVMPHPTGGSAKTPGQPVGMWTYQL